MQTEPEAFAARLAAFGKRFNQSSAIGRDPLGLLLMLGLGGWAVANCLLTIRRIIRDYNPLPIWDYWRVVQHLPQYRALDISVLWQQHNEHRIVFPEIVFALDMTKLGGHQYLPLVVSFLCYAALWMLLASSFVSDPSVSKRLRVAGPLLAAVVMFWEGSSVSLGNTFLLQWSMAQCAVLLALWLLAQGGAKPKASVLSGTIAAAVVATYSSGNGMAIWPILIVGAILLRMRVRALVILCIAAAFSIGAYFIGYRSLHEINPMLIIQHPFYTLGFICSYLSMPAGALGQPDIALCFGAFNLALFLFTFQRTCRNKLIATTPGLAFFGYFFFTLATAALTAAGRMNTADPKFLAALAARYVSLPLVNWAVLVLVLLWLSAKLKWQTLTPEALGVMTFLCLLGLTHALRPWVSGNGSFNADKQVATVSVENGLDDPALDGKLYGDPHFVPLMLPRLQHDHLAIYSGFEPMSWLGKNAWTIFKRCNDHQAGNVAGMYPVLGGTEIVGVTPSRSGGTRVVFVDETGRVVGIGERITAGVPAVLRSAELHRMQPWAGFVNAKFGSRKLSTYLVRDEYLCPLAESRSIPTAMLTTAEKTGTPIASVHWTGSGWKDNALPPMIDLPNATGGPFLSSWNGSDQSTGEIISSEITAPADRCVVLPIVHGPSIVNLSVRIAYSGGVQEVPLRPDDTDWTFWQIRLPSEVNRFTIRATDHGVGWGQWLGIGGPRTCK